jgi:hypothetical protein
MVCFVYQMTYVRRCLLINDITSIIDSILAILSIIDLMPYKKFVT